MSRNIPQITISQVMTFNAAGMPGSELFEIEAIIESSDEYSLLGRIRFEDASDLISLHNILGTYIRMNDLDRPDADDTLEEEGGDA